MSPYSHNVEFGNLQCTVVCAKQRDSPVSNKSSVVHIMDDSSDL